MIKAKEKHLLHFRPVKKKKSFRNSGNRGRVLGDADTKNIKKTEAEFVDLIQVYLCAQAEMILNHGILICLLLSKTRNLLESVEFSIHCPLNSVHLWITFLCSFFKIKSLGRKKEMCDIGGHRSNSAEIKASFAAAIWYSLLCKATFI
jgi:hypothetical protein